MNDAEKDITAQGLYVVNDILSGEFFPPFVSKNHSTAIRTFQNSIKDNPNSADYYLFNVGVFYPLDGSISSGRPELVCKGAEICNTKK